MVVSNELVDNIFAIYWVVCFLVQQRKLTQFFI